MIITTAHFENAAPALAEMDLGLLLEVQARLSAGDASAISDFLLTLAKGGKTHAFRKLAAIASASLEDLLAAEMDPAKMRELELAAAQRPFLDTVREAMGFFTALVPTSSDSPASSPSAGEGMTEGTSGPGNTPSAAS